MKDKKQNKPTPKPKVDHEQRRRSLQQKVIIIVSVILILSWILSLTVKF